MKQMIEVAFQTCTLTL